jgi:phage-related protein
MPFEVKLLAPAAAFVGNLPDRFRAKARRTIELLETFGYRLPEPHAKALQGTQGLRELRVKLGSDICRLFYFHYRGVVYIVTSGYVKKRDQTDAREIERAQLLRAAFIKEHGSESL